MQVSFVSNHKLCFQPKNAIRVESLIQLNSYVFQVHFCNQHGSDNSLGIALALTALNMAESCNIDAKTSESGNEGNLMSHIFALLALRLKNSGLPFLSGALSRYYMHKAKRSFRKQEGADPNLHWILSKSGQEFFKSEQWQFGQANSILTQVLQLHRVS